MALAEKELWHARTRFPWQDRVRTSKFGPGARAMSIECAPTLSMVMKSKRFSCTHFPGRQIALYLYEYTRHDPNND